MLTWPPRLMEPGTPTVTEPHSSRGERVQDPRRDPGEPRRRGRPGLSDTMAPGAVRLHSCLSGCTSPS